MTGSRRTLALFCLAAVLLAALAIAPAYALLAWILVTAPLFLDAPVLTSRVRTDRRPDPASPPLIPALAPRAPPCAS